MQISPFRKEKKGTEDTKIVECQNFFCFDRFFSPQRGIYERSFARPFFSSIRARDTHRDFWSRPPEERDSPILRILYFGIQATLCTTPISLSILLANCRLRVCTLPPRRHLLHLLYPAAPSPLASSHLLDLIEFFPEEEMFPPNESVEILHSDKHDPIFRLIKESLSPPCLRRTFS